MDLNPLVQSAGSIVLSVLAAVALMLAKQLLGLIQQRLRLTLSDQTQGRILNEVGTVVAIGVGMARAKLAAGFMPLADVHTGSDSINVIAQALFGALSAEAKASGIKPDDITRMIVGGIGHALGDDPSVPSIAPAATPPAPDPATAVPATPIAPVLAAVAA